MSARYKGEAFTIGSGLKAVLLLHGFTASTQEVESLGEALAAAGFTVRAPLMPGHNRSFDEFKKTTAQDYARAVLGEFDSLKDYQSVSVVGLSFGAVLALHVAAQRTVGRVVALAPAIFYRDPLTAFTPLLQLLYHGPVMKKLKRNPQTGIGSRWDLLNPVAVAERIAYPWIAFPQLASTLELMRTVRAELPRITCPLLAMHSKLDATTKASGSQYLVDHVGSSVKELVWLQRSGHVITDDFEAATVRSKVIEFLSR